MISSGRGLTVTYNALKDPSVVTEEVMHLRQLHQQLDRAVLASYGWHDVEVPPYAPATERDFKAVTAFEDEVTDRLYVLNAARAKEEARQGRHAAKAAHRNLNGRQGSLL